MQALVDYDNIPDLVRINGPRYVADRLCTVLQQSAAHILLRDKRLDLRFYGGWYAGSSLSTVGQQLAADVSSAFPFVLRLDPNVPTTAITIAASLAHALVILPKHTLYSTFRTRPGLEKVVCSDPYSIGCKEASCSLQAAFSFLSTDKCPNQNCKITTGMLIKRRGEQKLVDTMLVADLMHLAHNGEPAVAVVTSDDDVWPGVISGMQYGTHVIHVYPKYYRRQTMYLRGLSGKYSSSAL